MAEAAGVLLAGGRGLRAGREQPKQFAELGGKPLFLYALETMERSGLFERVVITAPPEWKEWCRQAIEAAGLGQEVAITVIAGGKTRQGSSYEALRWLAEHGAPELVLLHDAVRPFVTEEILQKALETAERAGAADVAIPATDTIVVAEPESERIAEIPPRRNMYLGQTPQAFRFAIIWDAHQKAKAEGASDFTDDIGLVLRYGYGAEITPGSPQNIKITYLRDFTIAEELLNQWRSSEERV